MTKQRVIKNENDSFTHGPWSLKEDEKCKIAVHEVLDRAGNFALKYFLQHGKLPSRFPWRQVSRKMITRNPSQCRERWMNKLSPTIKHTKWSEDEDDMLFKLSSELERKWAKISSHFDGRPPNACKLRWRYLNRKKKRSCSEADLRTKVLSKRVALTVNNDSNSWFNNLNVSYVENDLDQAMNLLSVTEEENQNFEFVSRRVYESLNGCYYNHC